MATQVKFKSLDKVKREVTMTVGDTDVTRRIPAKFKGTIDDYLKALANGLLKEDLAAQVKDLGTPKAKANEVLVQTVDEPAE